MTIFTIHEKVTCSNISVFRMKWITLLCVPFVAGCRMTKFTKEEGAALENHVIKTVTANHPMKCEQHCVGIPLCFSINVHAQKLPSGWVTCDLNNSSKTADPQDLVPKAGYRYHQMTVRALAVGMNSEKANNMHVLSVHFLCAKRERD